MRCASTLLLTVICTAAIAQTKKIIAESIVQEVTVFSSGAQIQRNATVAVPPGRYEIVFSGLSNQLQQHSVQLKSDANITLLSVQATKDYFSQRKIEQDEKTLVDRKKELNDKIDIDTRMLQVYKNEEQMLIKNQAIAGQNGVKADELKQALDLQRQRLTEVYQKQAEIEKRLRSEQQELAKSDLQLSEISKKKDSVTYTVTALIDSKQSETIKFQLLYAIKDAAWYPAYDVRVLDVSKPLQLVMNANVYQRSGETWKDVTINLSTGNPGDNATPSQLQPWKLGFYDPSVAWLRGQDLPGTATGRVTDDKGIPLQGATVIVRGTTLATLTDANGFFKLQNVPTYGVLAISSVGYMQKQVSLRPGYLTVAMAPAFNSLDEVVVIGYGTSSRTDSDNDYPVAPRKQKEIQTVDIITQYEPTTTVYHIQEKYSLETDGKTTTIGIKKIDVPALYEYFSAPKVDPTVFLIAKILNWHEYDLQSGEANLYFEGTYLGKTYVDLSAVGDTLPLSLGKDNSITISRRLSKEYNSKNFFGNNRTETKQYDFIIRNTKRIPVNILLQDQFPISVTKEIDISNQKAPGAQVDKDSGIAAWSFQLAAGQEQSLQLSYEVKYPKDRRVILE
ncbi:MAG: mucoidy inhibitor MuiA family protein [Flavisolibacter sp.]